MTRLKDEHHQVRSSAIRATDAARETAHLVERLRRELVEAETKLAEQREAEAKAWEGEEQAFDAWHTALLDRRAAEQRARKGVSS